jgi:hypothetical protein
MLVVWQGGEGAKPPPRPLGGGGGVVQSRLGRGEGGWVGGAVGQKVGRLQLEALGSCTGGVLWEATAVAAVYGEAVTGCVACTYMKVCYCVCF